jgi:nucleoside-diphosphate-sugar epimerase
LDIKKLIGSHEKAKRVLGWKPNYSIEEGLKRAADFWKNKIGVR